MIEVTRVDYVRVTVDDIRHEASNVTLAVVTPHMHDSELAALPPAPIAP